MPQSLSRTDLRAALKTVGALSECAATPGSFAREGVAALRALVASDLTTLSACNLATGHRSVVSDISGALSRREIAAFDRHFHAHPLVRAHAGNSAVGTRRISDLVSAAEFRRSPLYHEYYKPIRIEHAMAVPIHVAGDELVSFVLNRSGRDFSPRDRTCVEAIRPHLGNLFRLERKILDARAAWGAPSGSDAQGLGALTAREQEVMGWLAKGKTDQDIADILAIGRRTVHKHLQRIYEKWGVETRTAAAARWIGLAFSVSHPGT